MNLDPTDGIAIFCDGSASNKDKSGGWGWVALDAYEGIHTGSGYDSGTTISRMELMAATEALRAVGDALGSCEIIVYSDSEYVVKGFMDKTRKRNVNKSYWLELESVARGHFHVEMHHVKGHADHLFNEMADQLAGAARREGLNNGR